MHLKLIAGQVIWITWMSLIPLEIWAFVRDFLATIEALDVASEGLAGQLRAIPMPPWRDCLGPDVPANGVELLQLILPEKLHCP